MLVDLESLNGTFLNEKKVSREQAFRRRLNHCGKACPGFCRSASPELIDLSRGESEGPTPADVIPRHGYPGHQGSTGIAGKTCRGKRDLRRNNWLKSPRRIELYGSLTIIAGGTPQIIDLTKRLTTLGKSSDSDIKCSGLLVGQDSRPDQQTAQRIFPGLQGGAEKA